MVHKQARYWCWFNYQIKLTSKTKCGIDFVLCYTVLLNFPSTVTTYYFCCWFLKTMVQWLKCGKLAFVIGSLIALVLFFSIVKELEGILEEPTIVPVL